LEINKLILICGPSGSGKSTLLDQPNKVLDNELANDLSFLKSDFIEYFNIGEYFDNKSKSIDQLVIHIDLFNFCLSKQNPKNLKDLEENCLMGNLNLMKKLDIYINNAKEVIVLILYLPCKINFRRIINRNFKENRRNFSNIKIAVFNPAYKNGKLHKQLYRFFCSYTNKKGLHNIYVLNASSKIYDFIDWKSYLKLIDLDLP
tara:strand:+ start:605 stop:1213 length:609 start_codon:yes stop_codon:yes gene_type:complete